MRKYLPGFLAGVCTTILLGSFGLTALAASGAVSFNVTAIQFDGQLISESGADYKLDNGCFAPSSITYTDEKGGGTTYFPARRISELMGVMIGYDADAGAVTIASKPAVSGNAASVMDYSDWSEEEEAAYQEFEAYWVLETRQEELMREEEYNYMYLVYATATNVEDIPDFLAQWNEMDNDTRARFCTRLIQDYYQTLPPMRDEYFAKIVLPDGKMLATVEPPLKNGTYMKVQCYSFD